MRGDIAMPQLIDSIYVHQAVDEADIPRRHVVPDDAVAETAAPPRPVPPGPWSVAAHDPVFRAAPPGRTVERDLTPLFTILFVVWILLCCIVELVD